MFDLIKEIHKVTSLQENLNEIYSQIDVLLQEDAAEEAKKPTFIIGVLESVPSFGERPVAQPTGTEHEDLANHEEKMYGDMKKKMFFLEKRVEMLRANGSHQKANQYEEKLEQLKALMQSSNFNPEKFDANNIEDINVTDTPQNDIGSAIRRKMGV